MRKLVNPLLHIVGIICFLVTAIIYFILPTLRDLTGNIVTTINVCLILSQVSDLVRIFTEFSSHVSFIVAGNYSIACLNTNIKRFKYIFCVQIPFYTWVCWVHFFGWTVWDITYGKPSSEFDRFWSIMIRFTKCFIFRSRNVFLRVTDGRKYCYYMCYAWGSTILMCGLALFAHFMLDSGSKKDSRHSSNSFITNGDQETIGTLEKILENSYIQCLTEFFL